ncbi:MULTISPECIES: gliding motility-associated C-terminal domain-containing protein [unclassified Flavobacterium]|uniref:T9SS type B sorting domain-containing protein n=1 Tax=unclassified Flavobacterium TaxID=196869 RepID=UPI00131E99F5|nr:MULTISPECIES: gliding motility-associated C-terminal domain-containing protein [unclassified Flavobacterium]
MKCRRPPTFFKAYQFLFLLLFLLAINSVHAQFTINRPTLGFTKICANSSFNTFEVSFSFNPAGSLNTSNQFILELSDGAGDFSAPLALSYSEKPLTATPSSRTFVFAVPTTTGGENFRIRVRSTSPEATSPSSNAFAAYYKVQDTQYSINNFIANATYCKGGSYLLTIDNPGIGTNESPLKYPSLTYKWFKEPSSVPIATTPSLIVTTPGKYYVETNYGTCTSDSYSNRVTLVEASGTVATINSSKGNPFCSSEGPTILSTQAGNSYQWFLNNVSIPGATSQEYTASTLGTYTVRVDFGGCTSTGSINLENASFTSSLNVTDTTIINEGETKQIVATTSANNPTYEWFLNGTLIASASTNTLNVTKEGKYSLTITQTTGCISKKELPFIINYPFIDPNVILIPNLISPNNDDINDTWIIPQQYLSGTNTSVMILDARGEIVLNTKNYQNNWPENRLDFISVNPIYYYIITTKDNIIKKGSITVIR